MKLTNATNEFVVKPIYMRDLCTFIYPDKDRVASV